MPLRMTRNHRGKLQVKKKKTYSRRRAPASRQLQYTAKASINRSLKPSFGVLPARFTKLVYNTQFSLGNNTAAFVSKAWHTNALFDPEVSGGAHKPAQFEQLSTLYSKYRVYAFKFELICFVKDTSVEGFMVGWTTRKSVASPVTTLQQFRERTSQRSGYRLVNHLQPVVRLRSPLIYNNVIEGISKEQYRTDSYDSSTTTNPILLPKLDIFSATLDSSTATVSNSFDLRIVYYVKFWDPIQNNDPDQ